MENIAGEVVVVTGASSGLGAEAARHLVKEGAKVALGARRLDRLEALAQEFGNENCTVFKVDVTDREQVKAFVAHAVKIFGQIDVMMNNAGLMPLAPLEMMRFDEWDQCIDVNIKAVLWGIAAALPYFKDQKGGQFINVSSVAGHTISPGSAIYSATKYSVRVISEALRKEVKPYNIRTTVLSPGAVDTELPASVKAEGVAGAIAQYLRSQRHPGVELRPLCPLRHEPTRGRGHQRDPVSAHETGALIHRNGNQPAVYAGWLAQQVSTKGRVDVEALQIHAKSSAARGGNDPICRRFLRTGPRLEFQRAGRVFLPYREYACHCRPDKPVTQCRPVRDTASGRLSRGLRGDGCPGAKGTRHEIRTAVE